MACDDECKLLLGKTPDSNLEADLQEMINVSAASDTREYWKSDHNYEKRQSDWTEILEAGKKYYIQAYTIEVRGGDHLSVAVEIEQTEIKGHYHARREIQYLAFEASDHRDTTRVTLTELDEDEDGTDFVLSFQNPETLSYTQSAPISTTSTNVGFRDAIAEFYKNTYTANVAVTSEHLDKDDKVLSRTHKDVVKRVYTIKLDRLIDGITTQNIMVAKTNTTANIQVELPEDVQKSSTPVAGKYKIKCVSPSGEVSYTEEMNWDHH